MPVAPCNGKSRKNLHVTCFLLFVFDCISTMYVKVVIAGVFLCLSHVFVSCLFLPLYYFFKAKSSADGGWQQIVGRFCLSSVSCLNQPHAINVYCYHLQSYLNAQPITYRNTLQSNKRPHSGYKKVTCQCPFCLELVKNVTSYAWHASTKLELININTM